MRWSATLALCAAPLAFAGYLDTVDVMRRNEGKDAGKDLAEKAGKGAEPQGAKGSKASVVATEIIIIWINNGAGAPTQTVNAAAPPPSTASAGAVAAAAVTHQVTVGGTAGLVYVPDSIKAAIGDMVVFTFNSQNHTVTQSAFDTPCVKLAGGMNSGFMANPNNTVSPSPQMAMQVTVDTPVWFYCAQKGHCGKGMVFSINPSTEKTQAMFQSMAIAQNGTGTAAAIAGGAAAGGSSSSVAAAAATAAGGAAAAASPSSTAAAAAASGSIVPGAGTVTPGGQCACSCLCGAATFPSAAQGVSAFGGMSGAIPAALMEKRRRSLS